MKLIENWRHKRKAKRLVKLIDKAMDRKGYSQEERNRRWDNFAAWVGKVQQELEDKKMSGFRKTEN